MYKLFNTKIKTAEMKKQFLFFLLGINLSALSQNFHPQYEDQTIGWIKIYNYKGATKPAQFDEKKYSIAQLSIIDSFANWMQASYTPKGGLGDIKKYVTPVKNVYGERYNAAVPPSYGASAPTYRFLKKVNGKWTPENNLGFYWTMAANEIPLDNRLIDINTNKICLFTIPTYDEDMIREQPNSERAKEKKRLDLSGYPALTKYIVYTKPTLNGQEQARQVVILSKNNRFPFVRVTIGEMLRYIEDAFPVKYAEEKTTAIEQNSYDARHLETAMKNLNEKFDNAKTTLSRLKEKYKYRLNEAAFSTYGGYYISNLANGRDVFTGSYDSDKFDKSLPIYRVDPQLEAQCKTDKPQWITIKWFGGGLDDPSYKHMHEAIINNFDFDYAYNFFFDPEKVKGKKYQPRRSPLFEEKIIITEKSADAKKLETDASVFYFEDFSSTSVGQKPNGWKSELNADAKPATVVNVKDRKEKWLEIKGQYFIFPQNSNLPLPQNFELSFDLAVPKDIAWGAKALEFYLGTKNKYDESTPSLNLRLRAGFYGRAGEGTITGKFGNGYLNTYKNFDAIGFSNDKEFNNVKITLKKNGELFEFFIDKNKIADIPKAFPASTLFNWFQFKHLNSDADNQKYYITNFKITKV